MTFNELNIIMPQEDTPKDIAQRNIAYMHNQMVASAHPSGNSSTASHCL